MDDTTNRKIDNEPEQATKPEKPTPDDAQRELDRRQAAVIEAHLARQRAAMGFSGSDC